MSRTTTGCIVQECSVVANARIVMRFDGLGGKQDLAVGGVHVIRIALRRRIELVVELVNFTV